MIIGRERKLGILAQQGMQEGSATAGIAQDEERILSDGQLCDPLIGTIA